MSHHPASIGLGLACLAAPAAAGVPTQPETPAPIVELVYARPFTLAEGYRYAWNPSLPPVERGLLLVAEVDPRFLFPRQSAEAPLYVGTTLAHRVGHGWPGSRLVAIVPGDVDLTRDLIWFGTPELPERVTAEVIRRERTLADAEGISAATTAAAARALAVGGEPLHAADAAALHREALALTERYGAPPPMPSGE